jgi:hypothetical protein
MTLAKLASRFAGSVVICAALACGGSTASHEGDGSVADVTVRDTGHDARVLHDSGTGDALDAQCSVDATPPPDGSTACNGFSPGDCAGTSCSPEGLECSYTATSLTGVCCHGTWNCTGI